MAGEALTSSPVYGHASIAANATMFPGQDIVMAFPRMLARAGSFAFVTVPDRMDHLLGFRNGGSMIAEATGNGSRHIMSAALSATSPEAVQGLAAANGARDVASAAATGTGNGPISLSTLSFQQFRNLGGIFAYMTSKWALACFTLAIVLNRTQIYASARRHISLTWPVRLACRIIPILLFVSHTLSLLRAMRCQTSSQFSYLKYGQAAKNIDLDFSGDGGILYYLSSMLLFWQTDADSCLAVNMIPPSSGTWDRRGSLSLLWPLFQALCLGQFVETLACAVQGRPLMTETGMSIFEHSLAFAEAEGMLSNTLGISPFGLVKAETSSAKSPEDNLISRSELFQKLNTPPEVLLMGIISSLNNLSSQILGVLNMQGKYRLINTGIWGLCFMGSFVWGFLSVRPESGPDNIILRFPTVCIVGFIPHLLILIGILLCASIYSLAIVLCFVSPPDDLPQSRSFGDRFRAARENMQANVQLSSIRLDMHEDFYTALLKVGFTALTVASEAVFLNEGQKISVANWTWLEEGRLKEFEAFERSNNAAHPLSVHMGNLYAKERADQNGRRVWRSGYSRQTSVKAAKASPRINGQRVGADGVGHLQRGGRYFMAYEFFEGIFWLWVGWLKLLLNKSLDKLGVSKRPNWLRGVNKKEGVENKQGAAEGLRPADELKFWMLSDEGELSTPQDDDVDVEQETKKRLENGNEDPHYPIKETLDQKLYDWWKHGGWWGEKDTSGFYQPPIEDDDTTSVISLSTTTSETDNESDEEQDTTQYGSGRSTPTQERFSAMEGSRSLAPFTDHALDPQQLAALLDPKDSTARQEARMLAHHLTAPSVTTRSQYRHAQNFANAKLLTSTRYRPPNSGIPASGPLSPDEEAQLLEHLILTRRAAKSPSNVDAAAEDTWRNGAAGLGSGGPQCVVCQSVPRTILAWPCRCLSLCEECRVSLAMNNFATCVCCRQEVVGFSRLFVP